MRETGVTDALLTQNLLQTSLAYSNLLSMIQANLECRLISYRMTTVVYQQ